MLPSLASPNTIEYCIHYRSREPIENQMIELLKQTFIQAWKRDLKPLMHTPSKQDILSVFFSKNLQ